MALLAFPDARVCALSEAKPGSLIQYKKHLALALVADPGLKPGSHLAILSDDDVFALDFVPSNQEILVLSADPVLQVDVKERLGFHQPDEDDERNLYFFDDGPRIVVYATKGRRVDWSFVSLRTGEKSDSDPRRRFATAKWQLGVKGPTGTVVWLVNGTPEGAETEPEAHAVPR